MAKGGLELTLRVRVNKDLRARIDKLRAKRGRSESRSEYVRDALYEFVEQEELRLGLRTTAVPGDFRLNEPVQPRAAPKTGAGQ